MGENSKISWTHHTFNPWWGCQRVSPGCEHCYAEALDKRVGGGVDPSDGEKKLRWGPKAPRLRTSPANWKQPLRWNKAAGELGERHRVFCSSMADVFEDRPELTAWRDDLWQLIRRTLNLDWLLLTKRPENISRMMPTGFLEEPWENVWLGTTVEDAKALHRLEHLRRVRARVRFVSAEPLLEAIRPELAGIDWLIVGGESGGGARRFEVGWALALVAHARRAHVAPFVKQMGAFVVDRNDAGFEADHDVCCDTGLPTNPRAWPEPLGIEHDINGYREEHQGADVRVRLKDPAGGDMSEWPLDLRVREFPR